MGLCNAIFMAGEADKGNEKRGLFIFFLFFFHGVLTPSRNCDKLYTLKQIKWDVSSAGRAPPF